MIVLPAPYHFSVTEFYRMTAAGIFTEDDRVELIEGEIIEMAPVGSAHAACVSRLNRIFNRALGDTVIITVQNPVRLNDLSEPLPDIALLNPRDDFYADHHPAPEDILLVVEVADTSLAYDRDIKIPLYAKSAVPEVWLVDLQHSTIACYTHPGEDAYQNHRVFGRDETIAAWMISWDTLKYPLDDIF